jgi:hypothetical protein
MRRLVAARGMWRDRRLPRQCAAAQGSRRQAKIAMGVMEPLLVMRVAAVHARDRKSVPRRGCLRDRQQQRGPQQPQQAALSDKAAKRCAHGEGTYLNRPSSGVSRGRNGRYDGQGRLVSAAGAQIGAPSRRCSRLTTITARGRGHQRFADTPSVEAREYDPRLPDVSAI